MPRDTHIQCNLICTLFEPKVEMMPQDLARYLSAWRAARHSPFLMPCLSPYTLTRPGEEAITPSYDKFMR